LVLTLRLFASGRNTSDIENFKLIYHLVKEQRLTLEGARKKLSKNKEETINNFEAIESLNRIKEMLIEIETSLGTTENSAS